MADQWAVEQWAQLLSGSRAEQHPRASARKLLYRRSDDPIPRSLPGIASCCKPAPRRPQPHKMFEEIGSLTWSAPGFLLKPHITAIWLTKGGCECDFCGRARWLPIPRRGRFTTKTAPNTVAISSPIAPGNVVKNVRLSVVCVRGVRYAFAYDRRFGGPCRVIRARGLLPPQSSRYVRTAGPSSLEIGS